MTPKIAKPTTSERRRIAGWARDGALLLALALCVLSMDSNLSPWRLWWPMALAFISGALTLALPNRPILRWRHHIWLAVLILVPLGRGLLSLHGPLPAEGLRELQGLMSIALVASALWLMAAARPDRAFGIWTIALALGALVSARLAPKGQVTIYPAFVITAIGAIMGAVGWLRLTSFRRWLEWSGGMRLTTRRTMRIRREEFAGAAGRLSLRIVSLAFGCVLGWRIFSLQQPPSITEALQAAEGMREQELLWTQSLLLGWGHGTLERLMEAFSRPHPMLPPEWGGMTYLLATGGLVGFGLLLVLLTYMMLWPRGRWGIETEPLAPAAAHWGVMPLLTIGGLLLTGGPRSEMAMLALAGWLALALVKARIDPARDSGGLPVSHMAGTILLGMTAAVLIFSLARPAWGMSIYLRTSRDRMSPESYRARIERASELNGHEPRILMALADSWRQTMTESPAWSESNYLTVVRLYHDAEELDPYDSNIPLHLVDFLIRAERPAIEVLQQALHRMPKDTNLIKELLIEARRQKQPDLAYQMLQRGLMTDPADPWWWMQQAESALELGELPQAQRAIDIALTAAPDDAATVKAAWSAAHNALPALPPAG